jgi:hypothetical protein
VLILKDEWDRLEVYDGRFESVTFGAQETSILVQDGLEVYGVGGTQSCKFKNAVLILRDVASYKFRDDGYQRFDAHAIEWDPPTIKSETFRSAEKSDGVIHVGGCSLWTRNGSSSCEISVWARHMEIWADGTGIPVPIEKK